MNAFARSLVVLAIAGHIGLTMTDAYAKGAGAAGGSGGGAAGAAGASGGAGVGSLTRAQSTNGDGPAPAPAPSNHGAGAPPAPSGACPAVLQLSDPNRYASPLDGVAAISDQTQQFIERCGCNTQACIADALDHYAEALEKVTPRLPKVMRALPKIVHAAAQRARVAPTVRAAVRVLRAAVAVVHKTIALLRAADPDTKTVATRGGDLVARTLDTAATALERADTL